MTSTIINILNKNSENEINFLINKAREISDKITLILIGENVENLCILPTEKVLLLKVKLLNQSTILQVANEVSKYINKDDIVLLNADDKTNQLANLIASNSDRNILINAININKINNRINCTKQIYSNNLNAIYNITNNQIVTIYYKKGNCLNKGNISLLAKYDVYNVNIDIKNPFVLLETIKKQENKLKDAKIVVLIGKGVRAEDIPLAKKFASHIGAEIGATRPVTYLGLMPLDSMIGSSNISVTPDILITLGVSGSAPLITGIKNSKKIISINKDKLAMIFNYSDVGIIADTRDFLIEINNRFEVEND